MKATEPFYCLLLRFSHGLYEIKVLKYCNYQVEFCDDEEEELSKKTRIEKHDVIFMFRKRLFLNQSKTGRSYITRVKVGATKIRSLASGGKINPKGKHNGYDAICIVHDKEYFLLELKKIHQT